MGKKTSQEIEEILVTEVSLQIANICQYIEDAMRKSDSGVISIDVENLRRIEDQAHILGELTECIHERLLQQSGIANPKNQESSVLRLVKKETPTDYREVGLENVLAKLSENSV